MSFAKLMEWLEQTNTFISGLSYLLFFLVLVYIANYLGHIAKTLIALEQLKREERDRDLNPP